MGLDGSVFEEGEVDIVFALHVVVIAEFQKVNLDKIQLKVIPGRISKLHQRYSAEALVHGCDDSHGIACE